MKTLIIVVIFSAALSLSAQQATLTIYTRRGAVANAKQTATLGMAPGEYPYMGSIFDGETRLGYFTSGRFLTVRLDPGKHTFYASDHQNKNTPKAELTLDIKPGGQYVIRASMTHKGALFLQSFQYSLGQVSCEDARKEADTLKPIEIKKVDKEERNSLVRLAYFPTCQSK